MQCLEAAGRFAPKTLGGFIHPLHGGIRSLKMSIAEATSEVKYGWANRLSPGKRSRRRLAFVHPQAIGLPHSIFVVAFAVFPSAEFIFSHQMGPMVSG